MVIIVLLKPNLWNLTELPEYLLAVNNGKNLLSHLYNTEVICVIILI
jgi:hypothetical protein